VLSSGQQVVNRPPLSGSGDPAAARGRIVFDS
jgi:hypothetical protein